MVRVAAVSMLDGRCSVGHADSMSGRIRSGLWQPDGVPWWFTKAMHWWSARECRRVGGHAGERLLTEPDIGLTVCARCGAVEQHD